ncbi:unnamed protein product, partial [Urochloa humidicola]
GSAQAGDEDVYPRGFYSRPLFGHPYAGGGALPVSPCRPQPEWCGICTRPAEKSQERRRNYEESDQVVLKRYQRHGMGLLLLCFSYGCLGPDG